MELAILIILVCILSLLIFYGFYFTKKINSIYTDVHNTIVQYMSNYDKRLSNHTDNVCKSLSTLYKEFIDSINKAGNQHCDITNKAIDKSKDYYYKSFKIVLESLKVYADALDKFEEHIDKSIKEINCTKKKNNNKEIKIE